MRVAIVKAAEYAFEVGIHKAQQLALGDEWHDQAAALVKRVCAFGAKAQGGCAGALRLVQPRGNGAEQISIALALRHLGASDFQPACKAWRVFTVQHQQHTLGTRELGHFIDQKLAQLGLCFEFVQAHAGVHQAQESFLQVGLTSQMRLHLFPRQLMGARLRYPGAHDLAYRVKFVEVVAAIPFVALSFAGVQHKAPCLRQCV